LGEAPQLFPVLWGMWLFYTARGQHLTARELAENCLRLADKTGDSGLLVEAHHVSGVGLIGVGDFGCAHEHLEKALSLYRSEQHRSLLYVYAHDPAAVGLVHNAWTLWFLGYPDQALKKCRDGIEMAQKLGHPYTSATVATFAGWLQFFCGNNQHLERFVSTALELSTEHDFAFYIPWGHIMRGWLLTEAGQISEGLAEIDSGLRDHRANGAEAWRPAFLSLLAWTYAEAGQVDKGLACVAEALEFVDRSHERWWLAELFRIRGELLLKGMAAEEGRDRQLVEQCFRQALEIAQAQKAKSLELRAATSLSRFWGLQGRATEARHVLQPVYSWFSEGFEMRDMQAAKMLMTNNISSP